ncbi:MAG TPA: hypothetical protein VF987_10910 [Rhodospirillales bacterium]
MATLVPGIGVHLGNVDSIDSLNLRAEFWSNSIKSLARPGGNVTGIANLGSSLVAKQSEIPGERGEIVPHMWMIARLNDISLHGMPDYEDAARRVVRADRVIE